MSEYIRTVLNTSIHASEPEFFAASSFDFVMLFLSKLAPLLPLEISAGFLSEFLSLLSSEFLSMLSPVFVSMQSFQLFLLTSLELAASCLSELVLMLLSSTAFCSHFGGFKPVFSSYCIQFLRPMMCCSIIHCTYSIGVYNGKRLIVLMAITSEASIEVRVVVLLELLG